MGFALLLKSDISGTCERSVIKKKIIRKNNNNRKLVLTLSGVPDNPVWHIHISHRG